MKQWTVLLGTFDFFEENRDGEEKAVIEEARTVSLYGTEDQILDQCEELLDTEDGYLVPELYHFPIYNYDESVYHLELQP
jgi:alkanesulfonate monooxygenase SsuD/methylene tetrahydromethanopterin reductase-like flavin-dependent oxidoreductase (luciferase family)